jgi:HAD superfamily hydrolase (TIGR01509 family)
MTSSKQSANYIEAVAFDMDGLMFNTEDLYDDVGDILLQRRGQRFERTLKLKMMGRPGNEAFGIMKQQCGLADSVEQLREETREIFSELLPARIEMMPGLCSLLEWLEGLGVKKCVATSSHRQFATEALGSFDLEPRFEFVLTADDVTRGKPDPEVYLTAASRLDVSVNNLLVLEDSVIGSTAAAKAGALTIAVPTSHSIGSDFSHVRHVASSLEDPIIRQTLSEGR